MENALLTAHQVVLMLLLIAIGAVCARLDWFTERTAKALSQFLLYFVTPALLLDSFYQPFDARLAKGLALAALLAILYHTGAALLARGLLRDPDREARAIAQLGAVYSNCGFMAFPLVRAVLGEEGVFYGCAFVAVFNIAIWTHGRALLVGRQGIRLKNVLCAPGVWGTLAGILLYFSRLPLPDIAADLCSTVASLNTPLAMMVTGIFLSRCRPLTLLAANVLRPALLRTLFLPLLLLGALIVLRVPQWGQDGAALTLTIVLCAGCPSAASSVLMTSALDMDSAYGAKILFATCVLSAVTVPLLALAASQLAAL